MKKLAISCLMSITLLGAVEGEKLAMEKCGGCHVVGSVSQEKINNMKAPPYWSLTKKAREKFATEELMTNYMVDYIFNPSKEKMLFPAETLKRFGPMPSQKGKVTEIQAKQIVEYMLKN